MIVAYVMSGSAMALAVALSLTWSTHIRELERRVRHDTEVLQQSLMHHAGTVGSTQISLDSFSNEVQALRGEFESLRLAYELAVEGHAQRVCPECDQTKDAAAFEAGDYLCIECRT